MNRAFVFPGQGSQAIGMGVDEVIDPMETRAAIAGALAQLSRKRERLVGRPHANGPL